MRVHQFGLLDRSAVPLLETPEHGAELPRHGDLQRIDLSQNPRWRHVALGFRPRLTRLLRRPLLRRTEMCELTYGARVSSHRL